MITRRDFIKVKNTPQFRNFDVSQNNNGTICIKVSDNGTNYISYKNYLGIQYQIGYNEYRGEYWLRLRNGQHITPLHYNRNTRNYGFETFDDALDHLKNLFDKKYGRTESMYESYNYNSVAPGVNEVYNALGDVAFNFYIANGRHLTKEEWENALAFFYDKFFEDYDEDYDEEEYDDEDYDDEDYSDEE